MARDFNNRPQSLFNATLRTRTVIQQRKARLKGRVREKDGSRRKTPARRHVVTCGGPSRSYNDSIMLGLPSIILGFMIGCRCQVVGSWFCFGGIMLFGHPPAR
jgi:hypothetical protein